MSTVYEGEERRRDITPTGVIIPIWLSTIIVVGFLSSAGWLIKQQINNSQNLALMTYKIETLSKQIQAGTIMRYTSSQAIADFKIRDQAITRLYETMDEMKDNNKEWHNRVRDLERKVK